MYFFGSHMHDLYGPIDPILLCHPHPTDPHPIVGVHYIDRPPPTPPTPCIHCKGWTPWDTSLSPLDFYATSSILSTRHHPTPERTTLVAPSPPSPLHRPSPPRQWTAISCTSPYSFLGNLPLPFPPGLCIIATAGTLSSTSTSPAPTHCDALSYIGGPL